MRDAQAREDRQIDQRAVQRRRLAGFVADERIDDPAGIDRHEGVDRRRRRHPGQQHSAHAGLPAPVMPGEAENVFIGYVFLVFIVHLGT